MNPLAAYLSDTGLTQAQFAEMVGTTQGNVSKLCRDGTPPNISLRLAVRIEMATAGTVPVSHWAAEPSDAA